MSAYISGIEFATTRAQDYIELTLPADENPADYSLAIYNSTGNFTREILLEGEGQFVGGQTVFRIDLGSFKFGQINEFQAFALIEDDGEVEQFVSLIAPIMANNGPAEGHQSTVWGGGSVPCFAVGTRISTPYGLVEVTDLRVGDRVMTHRQRAERIKWLRVFPQRRIEPEKWPVYIPAHTFGWGRPQADLVLSPQHRVVIGAFRQGVGLSDTPCLVPAKSLVGYKGIRWMRGRHSQKWVHFALGSHRAVWANGCLTESLLLGPQVVKGLSTAEQRHLTAMFPRIVDGTDLNGPPAFPLMTFGKMRTILKKRPSGVTNFTETPTTRL
jgi:hypothetical protein